MIQQTIQEMIQQVGRLQRSVASFMVSVSSSSAFNDPLPDGLDKVHAGFAIEVRNVPHEQVCFVSLGVAAKGNECSIIRRVTVRNASGQEVPYSPWEDVFYYNPEEAPETARFLPLVEQAIKVGIRATHATIIGGNPIARTVVDGWPSNRTSYCERNTDTSTNVVGCKLLYSACWTFR